MEEKVFSLCNRKRGYNMKHCMHCGAALPKKISGAHIECPSCNETIFRNPIPVVVALVPIAGPAGQPELLVVKRAIPPQIGKYALPGGFLDYGKDWRQHLADEVLDECNLALDPTLFRNVAVEGNDEGTRLLVFALYEEVLSPAVLDDFVPNPEVSAIGTVSDSGEQLAFPLHTIMATLYFNGAFDGDAA